jgi:hypothetical protein
MRDFAGAGIIPQNPARYPVPKNILKKIPHAGPRKCNFAGFYSALSCLVPNRDAAPFTAGHSTARPSYRKYSTLKKFRFVRMHFKKFWTEIFAKSRFTCD